MAPLHQLNNVQKARLLHALFINEMPAFLQFLNTQCEIIRDNTDQIRISWQDGMLSAELWFSLSAETLNTISKYGKGLKSSSAIFSEQLFYGFGAIFLIHQLHQYIATTPPTDPKFKTAVELFF